MHEYKIWRYLLCINIQKAKKQKAKAKKVFCQVLDILCNVLWYFLFIDRTYIYVCTNSLVDTIRPMISMTITMIESYYMSMSKARKKDITSWGQSIIYITDLTISYSKVQTIPSLTDEKTLSRFSLQYAKLRMIQHFFCEMLTTCYQVTHPLFM